MKGSSQALNKKHASSFSTQAVHAKAPKKPLEPLTRAFFSQLLKSETEFYNKQYTVETLDELIQLYAKAVEYYDTIKDEIASYFIFKIQDALATKKSLKLLVEESLKTSFKRSTLSSPDPSVSVSRTETPLNTTAGKSILDEVNVANQVITENAAEESDGDEDGEDDVAVKEFSKKRKEFMEKRNKKVAPSFSTLKAQKQRFVNFYHKMELEKQKDPNKLNMHSLLDDFGSSSKDNDKQVLSDISKQRNRLKDLLHERRQRTMTAYTMSAISYNNINLSTTNFDGGYGKRFEEVLKDLDDAEESAGDMTSLGGTRIMDSHTTEIGKVKSSEGASGISINLEKSKAEEFVVDNKTLELSPIVDRSKRNLEAGGVMKYMQPSVPGVEMSLEDMEKNGEEEISGLSGIQEKENKDPLNES